MHSPQEFMQSYLREHAELLHTQFRQSLPFYEKHYGEAFMRHYHKFHASETQNREALVSVDVSGESAIAITTKTLWESEQRCRYHLVSSKESWRITRIDWRCHLCNGSGRFGDAVCDSCHGEGWQNGKQDDAERKRIALTD